MVGCRIAHAMVDAFDRLELSFTCWEAIWALEGMWFSCSREGEVTKSCYKEDVHLAPRRWASSVWEPVTRKEGMMRGDAPSGGVSPRGTASPRCEDDHASTLWG